MQESGTPQDIDAAVRAQLAALDVDYEIVEIDPALADTAAFCEHYGYRPDESGNTIVVMGKSDPPRFAACVVLATTRLDVNHAVRDRLGVRRTSFAPAETTRAITGMEIGGVTVFALPPDMPIWIDSRVMRQPRVVVGGGSRSYKIVCAPDMLLRLPRAEVVENLAVELPATGAEEQLHGA